VGGDAAAGAGGALYRRRGIGMAEKDARRIVVIGGGPAGVFAAVEAKRTDSSAEVVLLSEEACEPYEKPPLSKGVLIGKVTPEQALIAGPGGTTAHKVVAELLAQCTEIDRVKREVVTASGRRYPYDALVIATGCVVRELSGWPIGAPGVHYLRTEKDARQLAAALRQSKHLLLIGGGLIGLEAAASARHLGVRTTVLEVGPRILARVCDEETGAFVAAEHTRQGVDIHCGTAIAHVQRTDSGFEIETKDGQKFSSDLVLVGTGVKPNFKLASDAGLEVDDGIVVDEHCLTSDPNIFAAGDAVRFPGLHGKVRQENWTHAQEHGMVAGRNAAGANETYRPIPLFWSEQFDLYIQGVGWPPPKPDLHLHRPVPGKCAIVFETLGNHLAYAMGINVQRDLAIARRLIERQIAVDPAVLVDPNRPLADLLKVGAQR
jgi:3-phenylpropionate/trans-cinnamate dioxygenase ferredoxin reductase subunit